MYNKQIVTACFGVVGEEFTPLRTCQAPTRHDILIFFVVAGSQNFVFCQKSLNFKKFSFFDIL